VYWWFDGCLLLLLPLLLMSDVCCSQLHVEPRRRCQCDVSQRQMNARHSNFSFAAGTFVYFNR
jgi:hypothetical protein